MAIDIKMHEISKIVDTFETYHNLTVTLRQSFLVVLCAGVGPSPTSSITLVSL